MSKRVMRVMKVMMIGLLAMLAAKAEAHYRWLFGKIFFCSVCLAPGTDDIGNPVPMLGEVPDPTSDPAVAELIVKTKLVEISCPGQSVMRLKKPMTLSGQTLSTDPNWVWDSTTETANVTVEVDDSTLNNFCPNQGKVEILKMSATAKVYECSDPTCTNTNVLVTVVKFNNCTIKSGAVSGDEYDCNAPDITHLL